VVQEGEGIVNQCIRTMKFSFEIMEVESDEKYAERFKSFSSEVCTSFLKKSLACSFNELFSHET
jgi:hypothetical protein